MMFRSEAELERDDLQRLSACMRKHYPAYEQALELEPESVAAILETLPGLTPETGEVDCDRLREKIERPEYIYVRFHDELANRIHTRSAAGREVRERALRHLRSRAQALMKFGSELKSCSQSFGAMRPPGYVPVSVSRLAEVAEFHEATSDAIGPLLTELQSRIAALH